MSRIAETAVVLALTGVTVVGNVAAVAHELEPADREVGKVRVTYAERVAPRRVVVELNNGAAYRLRPCEYEDSRNCYWDASEAGNGIGRDFVDIKGKAYRVKGGIR